VIDCGQLAGSSTHLGWGSNVISAGAAPASLAAATVRRMTSMWPR
jgi:hypothetical protein